MLAIYRSVGQNDLKLPPDFVATLSPQPFSILAARCADPDDHVVPRFTRRGILGYHADGWTLDYGFARDLHEDVVGDALGGSDTHQLELTWTWEG